MSVLLELIFMYITHGSVLWLAMRLIIVSLDIHTYIKCMHICTHLIRWSVATTGLSMTCDRYASINFFPASITYQYHNISM